MKELSVKELEDLKREPVDPDLPVPYVLGAPGDEVTDVQLEAGLILKTEWTTQYGNNGRVHFILDSLPDGGPAFGEVKHYSGSDINIQVHCPKEVSRLFKGKRAVLYYILLPNGGQAAQSLKKQYTMGTPA